MIKFRAIATPAILSTVAFLSAGAAQAQTCNPGIATAYVAHQPQYDKVLSYIDVGRGEGAQLLRGGQRLGNELGNGYFVEPSVFGHRIMSGTRRPES